MAKECWRSHEHLKGSGDTLGNAQIVLEALFNFHQALQFYLSFFFNPRVAENLKHGCCSFLHNPLCINTNF
jgi:hypothetical protein